MGLFRYVWAILILVAEAHRCTTQRCIESVHFVILCVV